MLSPSHALAASSAVADRLTPLRSEMAVWAEPVIADCLADAYAGCGLGSAWQQVLALQHRRLWRALILDQRTAAERIWVDLEQDLHRAGLAPTVTEDIDSAVLDELMEIVFARYRASRDKTTGFGRVLLGAAARTVAVRPLNS